MKIYLARNNVQAGPYTLDELNAMLASGEVLLDDLMWHAGMSAWQKVGEKTRGQLHYAPQMPATAERQPQRGFGDNVDFKNEESKRVSVAELYGRKPSESPKPSPNIDNTPNPTASHAPYQMTYASIGSRFLAFAINLTLFIVAFLPFVFGLVKLNPDQVKMTTGSFEARMAYAQTLAEQLPNQVVMMTFMLLSGFMIIQLLLIIMRGQSFGKLVTGIRVVSQDTGKLPSFGMLVGMRTILLMVIYWAASALPFNVALVLVGVHYFMASMNPKKQGWHDRLAKTVVVKAHPSQLDKTKK